MCWLYVEACDLLSSLVCHISCNLPSDQQLFEGSMQDHWSIYSKVVHCSLHLFLLDNMGHNEYPTGAKLWMLVLLPAWQIYFKIGHIHMYWYHTCTDCSYSRHFRFRNFWFGHWRENHFPLMEGVVNITTGITNHKRANFFWTKRHAFHHMYNFSLEKVSI